MIEIGFLPLVIDAIAPDGVPGERVTVRGRMSDGDGKPINDGVLEIWQADAQGKYAHPEHGQKTIAANAFRGFGRVLTDGSGSFQFTTVKPGAVASDVEQRLQSIQFPREYHAEMLGENAERKAAQQRLAERVNRRDLGAAGSIEHAGKELPGAGDLAPAAHRLAGADMQRSQQRERRRPEVPSALTRPASIIGAIVGTESNIISIWPEMMSLRAPVEPL